MKKLRIGIYALAALTAPASQPISSQGADLSAPAPVILDGASDFRRLRAMSVLICPFGNPKRTPHRSVIRFLMSAMTTVRPAVPARWA